MRFITKKNRVPLLDTFRDNHPYHGEKVSDFWGKLYHSDNGTTKTMVFNHILGEQKFLCGYCQQKMRVKNNENKKGHVEHVIPKSFNPKLIFEYNNLIVSCDGYDHTGAEIQKIYEFCGHRKDREEPGPQAPRFQQNLFLNPTTVSDVELFFKYDMFGRIDANEKWKDLNQSEIEGRCEKANYMIRILDLNHSKLIEMRKTQYTIIVNALSKKKYTIEEILDENRESLEAFHSMIKYRFSELKFG